MEDKKYSWVRKFLARKWLVAIAGQVGGIAALIYAPQVANWVAQLALAIAGLAGLVIPAVVFIVTEGKIDIAREQNGNEKK